MRRYLSFGLIALMSFLVYIIVQFPISPIWNAVKQDLVNAVPDLAVYKVGGRIWQGEAGLQYLNFPESTLDWRIHASRLLTLSLLTDLKLEGLNHTLSGSAEITSDSASLIDLNGYVDAAYINTVSEIQGLLFSGRITAKQLNLSSDLRWLTAADGQVTWPGGRIISQSHFGAPQVLELPPLIGDISMQGEVLWLKIHHNDLPMLNIAIKPNGYASVTVLARLFDTAGLPWPPGMALDEPVLELEEKIF